MPDIAFIGLGNMGEPMAANLLRKGFSVTIVQHRRPEPVERLKELGAEVAPSVAEAAKGCEIAILALPGSAEVEDTLIGSGGLMNALSEGSVVVDCSTGDPEVTRRLAEVLAQKRISLVDAGLTRGVAGAKQGKLAYFVGGDTAAFERARPYLEAMGDTFFHMGPVGSGHETKNLSNALSYGTVALISEILMLGQKLGLDMNALQDALMSGAASKALESFGPRMIAKEYDPVRVSIQNVRAHLDTTRKITPAEVELSIIPLAQELFDRAADRDLERSDISAVAELWPR